MNFYLDQTQLKDGRVQKCGSGSDSEESVTDEEERLRLLFFSCDRDGDGFIDSQDLLVMCQQLNMEDAAVDEIMVQLGADERGLISWEEFLNCRVQLTSEIEQEKMRQRILGKDKRGDNVVLKYLSSNRKSDFGDYDNKMKHVAYTEVPNLFHMLETQYPQLFRELFSISSIWESQGLPNCINIINSLHTAALTCLKGEIINFSNRLHRLSAEKDLLEKQIIKLQSDRSRSQRESELRFEQQTARYEERVTELHSVIAELRKKLDRSQINIIREEEEEEDGDGAASVKNNDNGSVADSLVAEPQAGHIAAFGFELNEDFSQVVTEIEQAISANERQLVAKKADNQNSCDDLESKFATSESQLQDALLLITSLREQLSTRDSECTDIRRQIAEVKSECEALRCKLNENQNYSSVIPDYTNVIQSRVTTPRKSAIDKLNSTYSWCQSPNISMGDQSPVTKVAGLKKLKKCSREKTVSGAEIGSLGISNGKLVEHLVEDLQQSSSIQEIIRASSLSSSSINCTENDKMSEFEMELERRQSRVDSLLSQNDLLLFGLDESKRQCNHLTALLGQYESNCTALSLVASYSDQVIEAYCILTKLMESRRQLLYLEQQNKITENNGRCEKHRNSGRFELLGKCQDARHSAESQARQFIEQVVQTENREEKCANNSELEQFSSSSSNNKSWSATADLSGSNGVYSTGESRQSEEELLSDCIERLLQQRSSIMATVQSLELPLPMIENEKTPLYAPSELQRVDLEYAVLLQELMAVKEEKAELKFQNYQLSREKAALMVQLSGTTASAQNEVEQKAAELLKTISNEVVALERRSPIVSPTELQSMDRSVLAHDLAETMQRELMLKARLHEVMGTLEQVSRNSEERHLQSVECVDNLKKANGALVTAFEKVKRKYQQKVKKLEEQIKLFAKTYETKIQTLQQRIITLESEKARFLTGETVL